MFFYHVWRSGQVGNVTQIVSGCSNRDGIIIEDEFRRTIKYGIPTGEERFHLHLSPDCSSTYRGSNIKDPEQQAKLDKPCSLKHWFDNVLGFHIGIGSNYTTASGRNIVAVPEDLQNTIVIVLDPDQILTKPFQADYTDDPHLRIYPFGTKINGRIRKGYPFAQMCLVYLTL